MKNMLQSKLFSKTIKTLIGGDESKNALLLQRAGFIAKEIAGVYTFLPLGLLVMKKIENIIREEMRKLGGQEVFMPSLTGIAAWQKTGREKMDVLFYLEGRDRTKLVLNPTHEEVITPLMKQFIFSYRDLPFSAFQFQNKFRNEPRAKSGLLRGREFIMKDLYSFHQDKNDLEKFYEKSKKTYFDIFKRAGIGKFTYLTFASGGAFSKYSHEFQAVCPAGEDEIYVCEKCDIAVNSEIRQEQKTCPQCHGVLEKTLKAVEVGNIFKLGTKFSSAFDLTYKDKSGKDSLVEMGCYGIGLSRLMGVIVELFNDEKGIIWPKEVAPFSCHLIALSGVEKRAEKIYQQLLDLGEEVLYDDRQGRTAGEKFSDADLIGIPRRIVVSEKTLANDSVELKKRTEKKINLIKLKDIKQWE